MDLTESVEFIFLIIPYIKLIKRAKADYKGDMDTGTFSFVVSTLVQELDKETLYKACSIIYHCDVEELKKVETVKVIRLLPKLIKINNLIETMMIMKSLGAFD